MAVMSLVALFFLIMASVSYLLEKTSITILNLVSYTANQLVLLLVVVNLLMLGISYPLLAFLTENVTEKMSSIEHFSNGVFSCRNLQIWVYCRFKRHNKAKK